MTLTGKAGRALPRGLEVRRILLAVAPGCHVSLFSPVAEEFTPFRCGNQFIGPDC
jgi:hypothetical protein